MKHCERNEPAPGPQPPSVRSASLSSEYATAGSYGGLFCLPRLRRELPRDRPRGRTTYRSPSCATTSWVSRRHLNITARIITPVSLWAGPGVYNRQGRSVVVQAHPRANGLRHLTATTPAPGQEHFPSLQRKPLCHHPIFQMSSNQPGVNSFREKILTQRTIIESSRRQIHMSRQLCADSRRLHKDALRLLEWTSENIFAAGHIGTQQRHPAALE
jgi:hypothetical protein